MRTAPAEIAAIARRRWLRCRGKHEQQAQHDAHHGDDSPVHHATPKRRNYKRKMLARAVHQVSRAGATVRGADYR